MKIVTVVKEDSEIPPRLAEAIMFLDRAYPEIKIEFIVLRGTYGPELIQALSRTWNIPTNFMFIGSPNEEFIYSLADLDGVRLII